MHLHATMIVALLAGVHAQVCTDTYGKYLDCIKSSLDGGYCDLEQEYYNGYHGLVMSCFSQSPADHDKCSLVESSLGQAFVPGGPLDGCPICLTAARIIKGLFLTAPDAILQCIRQTVAKAVGDEIKLCVQQQQTTKGVAVSSQLKLGIIPDFDEKSNACRELTLNSTGQYIVADRALFVCAHTKERARRSARGVPQASATSACLAKRSVNGKPIWSKECDIMKKCRAGFGNCLKGQGKGTSFEEVEGYGCGCIETKRVEIQNKIDDAAAQFAKVVQKESVTADEAKTGNNCGACTDTPCDDLTKWKTCQCFSTAKGLLDANSNQPGHPSLRQVLKDVIGCTQDKDSKAGADVDGILKTLCFRIASYKPDADQTNDLPPGKQLQIAIRFIKSLFDALVLRVQRFCPGNHCAGVGGN